MPQPVLPVNFRIPLRTDRMLCEAAVATGCSKTAIVIAALDAYLNKLRGTQAGAI